MRSVIQSVLGKVLPTSAKHAINGHIRTIVDAQRSFLRSRPHENAYCVKANAPQGEGLPLPPRELWVGYGADAAAYLASGEKDVAVMARILEESGASLTDAKRILELGCATGRMLRHLPKFAPTAELWGVDINAEYIQWCVDHLTPAMPNIQFATATTIPHLPFEDRHFDLAFCGSVFTHIEDTQQTWLLELARVLRPSGRLFMTIHDEHTVRLLDTTCRDYRLAEIAREEPVYTSNKNSFSMIVIGRGAESQVFYSLTTSRVFCVPACGGCYTRQEAYFSQSAVLVEKLRTS
jgi:ubiquinone/menaquinone biosynthesis C-methylase UbiE